MKPIYSLTTADDLPFYGGAALCLGSYSLNAQGKNWKHINKPLSEKAQRAFSRFEWENWKAKEKKGAKIKCTPLPQEPFGLRVTKDYKKVRTYNKTVTPLKFLEEPLPPLNHPYGSIQSLTFKLQNLQNLLFNPQHTLPVTDANYQPSN